MPPTRHSKPVVGTLKTFPKVTTSKPAHYVPVRKPHHVTPKPVYTPSKPVHVPVSKPVHVPVSRPVHVPVSKPVHVPVSKPVGDVPRRTCNCGRRGGGGF